MSKLLQNMLTLRKLPIETKKYVDKVDENTEPAGENVKEHKDDVELNVDADVDVRKVVKVSTDVDD